MHRFAVMLAVSTLFLVALGGVVTTKGVGMSVPDWPTTYGDHMFLFPYSKWVGGVFFEHSHRLWASIVGLLTAVLLLWVWIRDTRGARRNVGIAAVVASLGLMGVRTPGFFVVFAIIAFIAMIYAGVKYAGDRSLRWLLVAAFCAVLVQGVLGGLRVTMDQHGWGNELGIFHGAFAQVFFLLVGSIALFTSGWWHGRPVATTLSPIVRRIVFAVTALVLIQLALGAGMRHQHAGLAIPDFPLAYGKLWPDTDSASVLTYNQHRLEAAGEHPITAAHIVTHMLHRITALFITLGIIIAAIVTWRRTAQGSSMRKLMLAWVALVLVQITLGAYTVWSQRKVDVTTAHVAVGALTFLVGWLSYLVTSRDGMLLAQDNISREATSGETAELKHA
jgi:heme a synthase